MFNPSTPSNTTSRTTTTGTLFNITTNTVSTPSTSGNALASTFSAGSLNQPFKPPTSQNAQLKSMPGVSVASTSSPLGGNTSTNAPNVLSFGSVPKSTNAGPTSFGGIKTSTAPSTTNITTVATSNSSSLPSSTTTSLTSSLSNKPVTSTGASTTQQQSLTFQQLEELILNKWTAELYEQEKVFLNQATQINIWDKVINENGEKLTLLHSTMEKVRKQQAKINDDLEIIFTHQKDLEACLVPMEKEDLLSVLKADPNRKNLYINAKKIDSQIKSMSEDLKETIEHINETSRSHDTEDPVIQVGRILNAHMESLRWIDEHTARMQDYFDSLLKMHDDLRRECELSKHDVY